MQRVAEELGLNLQEDDNEGEQREGLDEREAENQAMTSGHMLRQLDSEMARVSERLNVAQLELSRLAAERAEQEGILCARQSEIETFDLKRLEIEQQMATAQTTLAALRADAVASSSVSRFHAQQ